MMTKFLLVFALMSSQTLFAQISKSFTCVESGTQNKIISGTKDAPALSLAKDYGFELKISDTWWLKVDIPANRYAGWLEKTIGTDYSFIDVTRFASHIPTGYKKVYANVMTPEILHPEETVTALLQLDLINDQGVDEGPFSTYYLDCTGL